MGYIHSGPVVSFLRLMEMTWKLRFIYRSRVSVPFDSTMPSSFKKKLIECERIHLTCAVLLLKLPIFRFLWSWKKKPNNFFFFFLKASSFIIINCVYAVNTCFSKSLTMCCCRKLLFDSVRVSSLRRKKKLLFIDLSYFERGIKWNQNGERFFSLVEWNVTGPIRTFFLLSYLW